MTFRNPSEINFKIINDFMMSNQLPVDYSLRGLNPYRLAAIRDYAGSRILDVGCGGGAYVLALANEYDISGVDYREFPSWSIEPKRFSISDAHKINLPDCSIDTILSFETLEHLSDPEKALKEYYRISKKNVIITVPNCQLTEGLKSSGLIYNHWIDRTHVNFWTLKELQDLVSSAGFSIRVAKHINAINIGPVVMEAFGFHGRFARFGSKIFRGLSKRMHSMSLLVVAEKIN
jgi:SAM-dependent methyltransferase